MNVQLEKLFSRHNISEKDRHELEQIFRILSSEKKQSLLQKFGELVEKIKKVEQEMIVEQGILLDKMLPDIQELLKK